MSDFGNNLWLSWKPGDWNSDVRDGLPNQNLVGWNGRVPKTVDDMGIDMTKKTMINAFQPGDGLGTRHFEELPMDPMNPNQIDMAKLLEQHKFLHKNEFDILPFEWLLGLTCAAIIIAICVSYGICKACRARRYNTAGIVVVPGLNEPEVECRVGGSAGGSDRDQGGDLKQMGQEETSFNEVHSVWGRGYVGIYPPLGEDLAPSAPPLTPPPIATARGHHLVLNLEGNDENGSG